MTWQDGIKHRYHSIWLRDNSPDPTTKSPANGQRLITLNDIPNEVLVRSAEVHPSGYVRVCFEPENLTAEIDAAWLRKHAYDDIGDRPRGWTDKRIERWDSGLESRIPSVSFEKAKTDEVALASWLAAVQRFGFAHMSELPCESGALCQVVDLFGYVRETNYGRWFEVRSEIEPINLAYTGLGLQAHTDNPYRDPVPTLQLLACLENSADGGESIVVDGFKAIEILKQEDASAFTLLSRYCARFEYAGEAGVNLSARRAMIELTPDGELSAIRFNNRSAAAITDVPFDKMQDYYDAYRKLAQVVDRKELAVSFKLAPGELFIVDNLRVMHSRKAFSGAGSRWLQGCYADKDGLLSTLKSMEARL